MLISLEINNRGMTDITFEQIPAAISEALRTLGRVEAILLEQKNTSPAPDPDRWLDITELSHYLPDHPAVPTIYGYIHRRIIPFHKQSKKLYFLKSEIDNWLRSGRRSTMEEMVRDAEKHLRKRRA